VHLIGFYYKNFGLNSGAVFPILLSSFRGRKADCCTAFPASLSAPVEVFCRKFSAFLISFVHRIVPARLLSSGQSAVVCDCPYLALFVLQLFLTLARCKRSHLCSRRKSQEPQLVDTSEEAKVGSSCYD
jgi:hypothetical protein